MHNDDQLRQQLACDFLVQKIRSVENLNCHPAKGEPAPETVTTRLQAEAVRHVGTLAKGKAFSEYLIYLGAYAVLLHAYFNQEENVVVSPDLQLPARQPRPDHYLFYKAVVRPAQALKETIKGIREEVQHTLRYAGYAFGEAEAALREFEGVFQYAFSYEGISQQSPGPIPVRLWLSLHKQEADQLEITVRYDAAVFDGLLVRRFTEHYKNLVNQLKDSLDTPVGQITVLSAAEKGRLLASPAGLPVTYPDQQTIHQVFEAMAGQYPDHPAVHFEGVSLSYRQLNERTNQLAHYLRQHFAIRVDVPVGLMTHPSANTITGMLAILKAGGAYVPIDPEYPAARIGHTILDSGLQVLLLDDEAAAPELPAGQCTVVSLASEAAWAGCPKSNPSPVAAPGHLAYIIYTSGSTGVPKGVMVEHRNVVQLLRNNQFPFEIGPRDVWTLFHSVCFDFSVWEIFGALAYGGRLVIVPKAVARNPEHYADLILREQVTVLNQIPGTFNNVSPEILRRAPDAAALRLRYVVFGGDALNPAALAAFHARYPAVKLVNMYGITETTVHVTYKEIGPREIAEGLSNVGRPLPPMRIYIMDDCGRLKPENTVGEIVVGGEGVARGYLNRDELNRKHFIPDPHDPQRRLYRSGDLGRQLPGGEIIYMGRKDRQVKIRGYRIEIREIEHVLLSHAAIRDVVVVDREQGGGKELAAYLTADAPLDGAGLRVYLSEKLPGYMIPAYFVQLDAMPLTANGKVDRKALPDPAGAGLASGLAYVPPATALERQLAALWSTQLGQEKIGVTDNYFALGGDSMKAVNLVVAIKKALGVRIGIGAVFSCPTIAELADFIGRTQHQQPAPDALTRGLARIEALKDNILAQQAAKLPAGFSDVYPISNIEKGMIYSSLLNPGEYVFYDQFTFQLHIRNAERFGEAIAALVQRHDILRSRYYVSTFAEPVKVVMETIELPYSVADLSGLDRAQQLRLIHEYRAADLNLRLGFNGDLLWRLKAFRLTADHFYLIWSTHHALLDGWSEMIFYTDLSKLLAGPEATGLALLPPLRHSYKHYTAIEMGREHAAETTGFWKEALEGYTRCKLPFNHSGKKKRDLPGAGSIRGVLDTRVLEAIETVAQDNQVSVRSVFLSAYLYLLHVICSEKDVVAGIVSHDRPPVEDGDKILGCFLNVIPVRINFREVKAVRSLLKAVNGFLAGARSHEMYLSDIARAVGEKASNSNNPLFDCLLNFVNFHNVSEWQENAALEVDHSVLGDEAGLGNEGMTNTLFDVEVSVTGRRPLVILRYHKAYFDHADMEYAWTLFARILERFVAGVDDALSASALLSPEERRLVLYDFNDTATPYFRHKTMHGLFEERAAAAPARVALEQGTETLTYGELNSRANQLARHLLAGGLKPGSNVALLAGRNFGMITGMLAILKAGASYVPIEPADPLERQQYMLENSGVLLVLTDAEYPLVLAGNPCRFTRIDDPAAGAQVGTDPAVAQPGASLAYTIYTSGSTGRPKGVMIEHHAAVNLIEWVNREFGVDPSDRLLFITSMCFDLSVYDIFGTLAAGATVVIAREHETKDVAQLERLLREKRITFWDSVPTTLHYLVRELEAAGKTDHIDSLRLVFMSGDWVPVDLKDRMAPYFPHAQFISLGGATEGTVWSNYFPVTQVRPDWVSIPYGKPIANNFYYILDDDLQPVPKGVTGELWIGGVGVARGYANDEEKTARSFVKDPFNPGLGGTMYRTGDLGRLMADGNMEFLGRKDHQVKIRGYRVELGEIENCLTKHPAVSEAVVVAKKDGAGNQYLCAYVVTREAVPAAALRTFASGKLPVYMVPAHFLTLEALPLTRNGKINRQALPEPWADAPAVAAYEPPGNLLEEKLSGIWMQILKKQRVGIHDNVMEIGAHSLSIAAFVNQVSRELDVTLTIAEVFENPTVAEAARVVARKEADPFRELQAVQGEHFALSNGQRRLWIIHQLENNPVAYHMPSAHHLRGRLDVGVLRQVVETIIRRHEILRTVFVEVDGEPRQKVLPYEALHFDLPCHDLREVEAGEEQARQMLQAEAVAPFDLSAGPLLRVQLLHLAHEGYLLLLTMHHIVSDGWSLQILAGEILRLYQAYAAGKANPLPALPVHYKDYAHWQHQQLQGERLRSHQSYWLAECAGPVPVLELPTDHARPRLKTYRSRDYHCQLGQPLSQALTGFARQQQATEFMVLLAGVKALLFRYSGQSELLVGTPVSGRFHPQLANQIGFYLNLLPIRSHLHEQDSFEQLVGRVKSKVLGAFQHQVYPFDRLVDDLKLTRDTSRSPLFDVLVVSHDMNVHDGEGGVYQLEGVEVEGCDTGFSANKYDLSIYFYQSPQGVQVKFSYNLDLFAPARVETMALHLQRLLQAMLEAPRQPLVGLDYLTPQERHWLLETFNHTQTPYACQQTLHGLFQQQVRRTPHLPALRCQQQQLCYHQLNREANQLAHYLRDQGVQPGQNLALMARRGLPMVVAMLAILKAGAAYLPIDPDYPPAHQQYLLENSSVSLLLTDAHYPLAQPATPSLQITPGLAQQWPDHDLDLPLESSQLAYTIYTSGSTGRPKGVMVTHRAAVNLIEWVNREFQVGPHDRLLLVTSMCFDLSVYDIFGALAAGACLVVAPQAVLHEPARLADLLEQERITFWDSVPSTLQHLVDHLQQQHPQQQHQQGLGQQPASDQQRQPALVQQHLRLVFLSGDWIPVSLPARLQSYFPAARVISLGGATEATVWSNYYPIGTVDPRWNSIPYGKPIANTRFLILDAARGLVPRGVSGELYIGGQGLALGYANDPERTAASFVADPFQEGERLYRTGDLGRLMADGNMEFLGRKDQQVKIRGYRVEPAEVESLLGRHPLVSQAVVLAQGPPTGRYLVGYYQSRRALSVAALRQYLGEHLPAYLVPDYLVSLESFPLNANGKIDRKQLPAPQQVERPYQAPRPGLEEHLSRLWCQVLEVERVGREDNFFELGGHSLKASRLLGLIGQQLRRKLALREVFAGPSLLAMAGLLRGRGADYQPIEALAPQADYPVSHAQQRLWILQQLEPGSYAYNVPRAYKLSGPLREEAFGAAFAGLVSRHQSLRTTFVSRQGVPYQRVHPVEAWDLGLVYQDLSEQPEAERQAEGIAQAEARRGFDLERGPMLRAQLLRVGPERYVFCYTLHHIIFDGWSEAVLVGELLRLYQADGEAETLPPLRIHYKDYAGWQNGQLSGERLQSLAHYWREQFSGPLPVLALPTDFPRPKVKSYRGDRIIFFLDEDQLHQLNALGRRNDASLFMTLVAVVKTLLYKLSGQEDIVVGSPIAGRNDPDLENQIGLYLNSLALRTRVKGSKSFESLLCSVKETTLGAYQHQDYPFDLIVRDLGLDRDLSRYPLFDVWVVLQNTTQEYPHVETDDLKIESFDSAGVICNYDLKFAFEEIDKSLLVNLEYSTDLFGGKTAGNIGEALRVLLTSIATCAAQPLDEIKVASQEELQMQVAELEIKKQKLVKRTRTLIQ